MWENLWEDMSLVKRMTMMITCFLIIPTALICIFCFEAYEYYTKADMMDALQTGLNSMDSVMESNLEITKTVLEELNYSQELLYILDGSNPISEEEQTEFLKSVQENWMDIYNVYPKQFSQLKLYTTRDSLIGKKSWKFSIQSLDTMPELLQSNRDRIVYLAPKFGQEIHAEKASESEKENLVLQAWLLVRDFRTQEVIGAVELDLALERMMYSRQVQKEYLDINYLLMGKDGQLYYQTGDLQTEQFNAFGFTSVLFMTDGKVRDVYIHGNPYWVASRSFDQSGLMGAVLISQADVLQSAKTMLGWIGIVAILGILGMMTLTHFSIRQLLNRLMRLDDVIRQVHTGDLTITVEEDEYNDEISRIKRRFNEMTAKLQELIRVTVEQEKAQKDAELRALQAQVNPHFLYNTLESMRMQCEIDQYYVIGDALEALGNLLHYTAKWQSNEVTFRQEWKYLKNYIAVMSVRLGSDFTCVME